MLRRAAAASILLPRPCPVRPGWRGALWIGFVLEHRIALTAVLGGLAAGLAGSSSPGRALAAPAAVTASPSPGSGIAVSGRVVASGGGPIADVEVLLLSSLDPVAQARHDDAGTLPKPESRAVTDGGGRFLLNASRAGLFRVRVQAPGFVPIEAALEPLIEPIDLPDAELVQDAGLTVKVTQRGGAPLPGARARLAMPEVRSGMRMETSVWQPAARTAIADEKGALYLPHSSNERSVLSVAAPGHLPLERRSLAGTAAVLALQTGVEKTVLARAADGSPAPAVLVIATDLGLPLGFTDAKGQLKVTIPARGSQRLTLVAEDGRRVAGKVLAAAEAAGTSGKAAGAPKPGDQTAPPPAPRIFSLPERAQVRGRLIDARTRAPIGGGLAWIDGELWGAAVTDPAGRFALRGPARDKVTILAGATGYLRAAPLDHTIAADASSSGGPGGPGAGAPAAPGGPTLALKPAAAVEGIVVDEGGGALAGAELTLAEKRDPGRMVIRMGREPMGPRAVTTARGTFRLSPIDPDKNYDLKASAKGFAPSKKDIVGLEARTTMSGVRVEMGRGQTVTGVVTDADGKPVRDADASLRPSRGGQGSIGGGMVLMEPGSAQAPALRAATDGDGRFRISGLANGTFDLELRRAGFAKKTVPGIEVAKKAEPVDVGAIVLEPGLRVQGLVNGPDQNPIEGAEISILTEQAPAPMMMIGGPRGGGPRRDAPAAVTGADGRFAIDDLPRGEKLAISIARAGYLNGRETGIALPQVEPLQITLQPSSKVSGIVKGADGKPVAGADVTLTRTAGGGIGGEVVRMFMRDGQKADDEGRFLYDNVQPGQIALSAVAPGLQEAKLEGVDVPEGKDVEGIELPLKAGSVVTGRVLGPDGRAAIGARINLVTDSPEPIRIGGTLSDGDGNYRIDGLAPGKVAIEATHDDYVRTVREIDARPGANKLDLQFEGGQEVSGLVTDAAGTPIAGAMVSLMAPGRMWGGPEAHSTADGTFHLLGVGDGDYQLNVIREGFAPSDDLAVHVAGKPVPDLKVQLGSGGTIVGTVRGVDPEKLVQVAVRAGSQNRMANASASVGSDGGYRLTGLAPGSWTVTATLAATGQQARGTVAVDPAAAEAHLDLEFGKGLALSGKAVVGEAPLKGAVLFAQGTDINRSAWGRTDNEGAFRIEGLEPGTYRVELRQWETGISYTETFEVAQSRDVVLRVPIARIVGRVVDGSERRPLAGVALALSGSGGGGGGAGGGGPRIPYMDRGATSDLNGRFEIANVPNGAWTLTATKSGFAAATSEVNVDSGHDVDNVALALDATEGLTVEVHLVTGRVPDTVDLAVLDASGRTVNAGSYATGENGRIRLSSVPPGSWEVLVSAAGSGVSSMRASVPGQTVAVTLPPACALKVSVPALDGSSTSATATIAGADGRPFRELGWMGGAVGEWRLAGGRMQIDTMPPGSWTVRVSAADGRTWTGSSSTQPSQTAEVVLQ